MGKDWQPLGHPLQQCIRGIGALHAHAMCTSARVALALPTTGRRHFVPVLLASAAVALAEPAPGPARPLAHWGADLCWTGSARQVFNAALLLAPDGRILGHYEKQQLLAFGEYMPLQRFLPFLRTISPAIGNLTPGAGGIVTLPNGVGIGPLICYEDILPALGRQAVRQGAQVLVNLTNDVWFGPTHAPYQHRALATFRAVENRVSLVRVTNTGLTSIIDALGRERAILPLFRAETLVQTIQLLRLPTVYTRFGDWFAQLCCVLALLLSLWSWRRQAPPQPRTRQY